TKTFQGDFMFWDTKLDKNQVLEKYGQLKPSFDFRNGYGYCNSCFLAAGEVISAVSKKSWSQELTDVILNPLGMTSTRPYSINARNQKNMAVPHTFQGEGIYVLPYPNIDNIAPAGSMISSIHDLSKWVKMQLDSGRLDGKIVLPWEVIRKTRNGVTFLNTNKSVSVGSNFKAYGLGWFIGNRGPYQVYSHSGGADGFVSQTVLVPEKKLGVVVLTNTDNNPFFSQLAFAIIHSYLNVPFVQNLDQDIKQFQQESILETTRLKVERDSVIAAISRDLKPEVLKKYVGVYEHPIYGKGYVSAQGTSLKLTLEHHTSDAILEYKSPTRFLTTYSNMTYGVQTTIFSFSGQNEVESMEIKVNDFVEYDSYTFRKIK
ncbi:MAG: serine hydrolase, partial [Leadbetterella sp.]